MSYRKKLLLTCLSLAMVNSAGAGTGRNRPSHFKDAEDTRLMRAKLSEMKSSIDDLSVEKLESTKTADVPRTLKIEGFIKRNPKIMFTDDGKVLYHNGRKSFPFWTSEYTGVLMEDSDLSGTTTIPINDSERYSPGELESLHQ